MDEINNDSRFAHVSNDARFKKMPRREKKVKIDKRFQSMFTDKRFQLKSTVDKRGRPQISRGSEHLERFYDLSSSDSETDSDEAKKESAEQSDSSHDSPDPEDGNTDPTIQLSLNKHSKLTPEVRAKLKDLQVDYARGEGYLESDSSSDEETSSGEEEEEVEHQWGEMDREAEVTEESTSRLALCNMDWDRISAQDIMVLIHSCLPPKGVLKSVTIYPSEFGMIRLQEEEVKGPSELASSVLPDDKEEEELSKEQRESLREYQMNRLRYFYAVLEFDSVGTADHVYKECDGLEYESSMNKLDLRFIPDDTSFEQSPREKCDEVPDLASYKPRRYLTSALAQVKVDLTWDETDPIREQVIRAACEGKFDDKQIDKFLASSSDDDEAEEKAKKINNEPEKPDAPVNEKKAIEKYKALLADLSKAEEPKKEEIAMEVTWDLKLEQKAAERVKEATKTTNDQTPFERFLDKRKEKKKAKKEERKTKRNSRRDSNEDDIPFSDDDVPSDIDMDDTYFKQELDSGKRNGNKKGKGKKENDDSEEMKQKKAELELLMLDEIDEGPKQHFSLKKIEESEKKKTKRKLKKKKTELSEDKDSFKMDVKDERFSAIFTSHLYNVDPAQPFFRATDGMKALISEKVKRKCEEPTTLDPVDSIPEKKKKDAELNLLIKSVQRKTQAVNQKKSK